MAAKKSAEWRGRINNMSATERGREMKVRTFVEIEQEIEVEVSITDVMSTIASLTESDQLPMLLDCISSVHRVLCQIPDDKIAAMNEKQRSVIHSGLRRQADRYKAVPLAGALGIEVDEASNT